MGKVKLHFDADPGVGKGKPTLILLHGFTQDTKSWNYVREGLRRVGPTVAVDLVGHGRSPRPGAAADYTLDACLEQLEDVLKRLKIQRAWWVGYSMGGRVTLHMAWKRPELMQGMVLVSTTPGIADMAERLERRRSDHALADRLPGWGMEAFVQYWEELPVFASNRRLPANRARDLRAIRLANDPTALGHSLRQMGTGNMIQLWPYLRDMEIPTFLMAGARDDKFAPIARNMLIRMPQANLAIIPGTGHSPHIEHPENFLGAFIGFFQRLE